MYIYGTGRLSPLIAFPYPNVVKEMDMKGFLLVLPLLLVFLLSACVTVGYSYARDPNAHQAWHGTVIAVEDQNIYNSEGASWVGTLAKVEAVGLKVSMVMDDGEKLTIVQPKDPSYTLHVGDHIYYIADKGRVWAQPDTLPLPPDVTVMTVARKKP